MPPALRTTIRRGVLAAALVAVSALCYHASVHPDFRVDGVSLVAASRPPGERRARIDVPPLPRLRDTVGVITTAVGNASARRQGIRILLDGVDRAVADVGPHDTATITFVASAGTMRALAGESGNGHAIELVGENNAWNVTRLEIGNARWSVGHWLIVVPDATTPSPPARGIALTALVTLGLLGVRWGLRLPGARVGRAHALTTGLLVAVLLVAWLLPQMTPWRMLVAPVVFWAAVLSVFAAPIFTTGALAWRFVGAAADRGRRLGRVAETAWRRHATTLERGAVLLGLVALAVCQPLYEVIRDSPEFFVARNTPASLALLAAATLGAGVPLLLLVSERSIRAAAPRTAAAFFFAVVALLVSLLVHPWLKRRGAAAPWTMAVLALAAGAVVAGGARRFALVRQFLIALAPAALVVPALFFTSSEVRDSLVSSSARIATAVPASTPPIVLIVFDEFPVHSLLDADGQIDSVRFPNFAALSRQSTWYREATAVSSQTVWAVPAIASGRYPVAPNAVPNLRYYPQNLFTLLADRYEMFVFGRFLQLCPPDACHRDLEGPGDGPIELLADLAVVWLHIVLPTPLTERLPPVVGDWQGFARTGRRRNVGGVRVRNDRRGEFERFLDTVNARPARLYFLHSLLPHMPFEFVPSEHQYVAPDYQGRNENGAGLFERVGAAYADALHQRHLLQVGFVDTLIGRLLARLREVGVYDEALVIVTADHGASYREGMPRRAARRRNLADIIRVPLFVKRPRQESGGPVDGVAQAIDILPTIADALGMRLPFPTDGRSLIGRGLPRSVAPTFIERSRTRVTRREVGDWRPSSQASLARRVARFSTGSYQPLYAVPGTEALLGLPLEAVGRRTGRTRMRVTNAEIFAAVDPAAPVLPLYVRGRIFARLAQPVAVAVNGRIAAITDPYEERGARVFATMIPEAALRAGRNDIALFVVERTGSTNTLLTTVE